MNINLECEKALREFLAQHPGLTGQYKEMISHMFREEFNARFESNYVELVEQGVSWPKKRGGI